MQFLARDIARLGRCQVGHGVGDVLGLAQGAQRDLAQQAALLAQIPLGRLGEAKEVAEAVAFLAGPNGGYVTGSELHVNGGMYMC